MTIKPEALGRFFETYNSRFGKCLAPGLNCSQAVIRAHSIQNARVIDLLEENGHVVALRPRFSDSGPSLEFKSVGRNEASTFTGLCSEHDGKLFTALDTKSLDVTDGEQLFLLAYRSVTRELHAVMDGAAKIQAAYMSRVKRGLDPADVPSPAGMLAIQHLMNSYSTHLYRENNFDGALLSGKFDAIEHDVITLGEQAPAIAVSALFSLDEIWKDDDIVRVVLNLLPIDQQKTLVIFSYTKDDRGKARAMLDRALSAKGAYQKYELSKLIVGRIENFLIAPAHFATWGKTKRRIILHEFATTVMAGTEPKEHPDLMLF